MEALTPSSLAAEAMINEGGALHQPTRPGGDADPGSLPQRSEVSDHWNVLLPAFLVGLCLGAALLALSNPRD